MSRVKTIESEIFELNQPSEVEYFRFHKKRYERFESFLKTQFAGTSQTKKMKALDIGSHYLHSSMILSKMNFEVDGMDVSVFWDMDFVKKRGAKFGITPIVENDLAKMPEFQSVHDRYDLVVFTEIFEHITFNPIQLWKTIHQILKPGGKIYISTPNSLALANWVRNFKNLITLKSVGITVDDIISKVTYGHHWKEYSPQEIKTYFGALSEDFHVTINPYHYKEYELKSPYLPFKLLAKLGNLTKTFAEELEVIVELKEKKVWKKGLSEY
ncbi:class I SAM-dependent methyltransferase [Algoriphagus litoralis]|uniref:class I SAM-dependent methyltransferase n=1 Tax=Algoriphagus litoralis TaxID=2202829 RepID=UPI000DBA2B57|nr:methyltransferase domain-containing protein [Algoriphagus litoralis]